jgi:hypothetical protein
MTALINKDRTSFFTVTDLAGLAESLTGFNVSLTKGDGTNRVSVISESVKPWVSFKVSDLDKSVIQFNINQHVKPFVKKGEVLLIKKPGQF